MPRKPSAKMPQPSPSIAGGAKSTKKAPAGAPAKAPMPEKPSGPRVSPAGTPKPKLSEVPDEPARPTAAAKNFWAEQAAKPEGTFTPAVARKVEARAAAEEAKYQEGITNYFEFVGQRNSAIAALKLKIKEYEAEVKSAASQHANR